MLQNRAFVPVYNCFLSRFLNRDWLSGINTCISFVPEAIESGQMLISRTKKIRSLAPRTGASFSKFKINLKINYNHKSIIHKINYHNYKRFFHKLIRSHIHI